MSDLPTVGAEEEVEVRVADVPATVAETVLLATLIRAAAMTALDADDRGDELRRLPPGALRAALLEGRPTMACRGARWI